MKKVLLSMIVCAALFTACKKDKVPVKEEVPVKVKTTTEKVQAKWNINSYALNYFYSNTPHNTTYAGAAGDYMDFRVDGKVYLKFGIEKDTLAYSIPSDTKIIMDGDPYDIKTLTDNQFVMYSKTVTSTTPSEYDEITITLSK